MASIKFQLIQTETELSNLKKDNEELLTKYMNLEKEYTELKISHQIQAKIEKTYKNHVDQIHILENEIKSLKNELASKESQLIRKEREMQNKLEKEIIKNRNMNENIQSKIENATAIHRLCDKQQIETQKLENELLEIGKKFSQILSQKELKYEMNFSELKKKMVDYIKETHRNITKLNVEQLDTSSKLTMLQNHQLLIELEYNSRQIEDLLKKIEKLEKSNFDLRRELEINKEVQVNLAGKNKNISEIFQKIVKKEKKSKNERKIDNIHNNHKEQYSKNIDNSPIDEKNNIYYSKDVNTIPSLHIKNQNWNQNFDVNSFNFKKIQNLEKLLKKKEMEYNTIRTDYDIILQKLNRYEMKSRLIFDLIETGFKKLSEDDELKNSKEIFVNVENLKISEFNKLSNEEKYSILMMLLKYLLPILNLEDIDGLEYTKNIVNNVKMRHSNRINPKKNIQSASNLSKTQTENFRSLSKMKMNKLIWLKNAGSDIEREKENKLKTSTAFFIKNNSNMKENQYVSEYYDSINGKDNKYNKNYKTNIFSI